MNLTELSVITGCEIKFSPALGGGVKCSFVGHVEICKGGELGSVTGFGKTHYEAHQSLVDSLCGQKIAVRVGTGNFCFQCPDTLCVGDIDFPEEQKASENEAEEAAADLITGFLIEQLRIKKDSAKTVEAGSAIARAIDLIKQSPKYDRGIVSILKTMGHLNP